MKSNMKKFLALFLSLSLVLAMFGDFAQVKAADSYIDVTLTGLHENTKFNDTANQVELWFTIEGGFWTDSNDWSHQWEHFKYEVNGVEKRVAIVQSAGPGLLYATIPYSDVSPTVGNKITIKKDEYAATAIETDPAIHLQNDFEIVFTCDRPVVDTGYKIFDVGSTSIAHGTANQIQVDLKDKAGNPITFGRHTDVEDNWGLHMLTPATVSGSRMAEADWPNSKNGVFQNNNHIAYWSNGNNFKEINTGRFYIGGLNATEGTVVTIKGAFADTTTTGAWTDVGKCIFKEFSFTYTNGTWVFSKPYRDVTKASLFYAQDENGDDIRTRITSTEVQLWLNIDSGAWSTSDWTDWMSEWYKFVYEINGVKKNAAIVQAAGPNLLYVTIPISDISTEAGTKITIKAGEYPAYKNTNMGINLLNDFEIVFTCDMPVAAEGYKIIDVGSTSIAHGTANQIQVDLKDKAGNPITFGRHTDVEDNWGLHMLTPATVSGSRMAEADWPNSKNGVFQNNNHIAYWSNGNNFKEINTGRFYIGGLNATEGTVVTIKGAFADTTTTGAWTDVGKCIFKEFSFTYTNGTWVSSVTPTEPTYKDYTGTPELQEWNGVKGFYFWGKEPEGTTEFPYDTSWNIVAYAVDEEESGVFIEGEKIENSYLKKVDKDRWYVDLEAANVAPEDGDEITIAGTFVYTDTDGVNHRIKFNEVTFIYETPEAPGTYQGTPVLHEQDAYGKASGFYFSAGDCVPKRGWNEDLAFTAQNAETDGVFIKTGTETTKYSEIHLQKVEADIWYIKLSAASNLSLSRGDVVIIKGKFASSDGTEVTFTEAKFQFDGKHFGQGEFIDGVVDFTITDLYYNNIVYDETNKCWNIYVTPNSNTLPGEAGSTYYPYMTCVIDGEEYDSYWHKTTTTRTINGVAYNNILIQISADALPKDLVAEHTIIFKARTAQRRTSRTNVAHADGVRLAEDFPIIVGDCYEASAPAVDYGNTGGSGGDTTALWLTSNDDFPIVDTSWTHQIKKVGTGNGVYVYNDSEDKFEETNVIMKQHQDNQYYVSLKEGNVTVEDGTVIMLKGTFSTGGLHFVTFNAAKYKYSSGKWEVYTEVNEVTGTGIDGDATGTDGLNSVDLVRMKKYLVELSTEMNYADADLNVSGKIDENDIAIERKLLVGLVLYKGAPTYENTEEAKMRLAAYVAPELSDGQAAFDTYAKAGFTTIIGENTAVYDDADDVGNLSQYMTYAANAELDVLIQAGSIQNMAEGKIGYNQTILENAYNAVSRYDNFRGLFMGDEPGASEEDSYKSVTKAIRQLAGTKEIDLFLSCHPVYTEEAIYEDSTGNMSDIEKYANYVDVWGRTFDEFTYDFYPFRNKTYFKWDWFDSGYVTEDYMREQWFTNLNLAASRAKNSYETEHFETGFTVQSYAENADIDDYYRTVSQADISYQVYSALAFGVKSINYFTYGVHWSIPETTNCMVDANGNTTDIYDSVQNVNSIIQKIDNVLLNYNWDGTIAIEGEDSDGIIKNMNGSFEVYESNRISSYSSKKVVNGVTSDTNADAIIGCLKDTNGYDGFMIVNATDPIDSITNEVSVTFKETLADGTEVVSTHATVYENGEMITKPLDNGTFTATLSPGQGIFVIPYIQ